MTPDTKTSDIQTSDVRFLQWLIEDCGYLDPRPISGGRYLAIAPYMFTHAVIIGRMGDRYGFDDRWCYHDYASAKVALDAWDGQGEPAGWHRHPASGRRVSESADEIGVDGPVGAVGVAYVRG